MAPQAPAGEGLGERVSGVLETAGATLLLELSDGLLLVRVPLASLREQDMNARLMPPRMFDQLAQNIRKRSGLESLPLLAIPADRDVIEIVSGHHRVRAARVAGLETIPALLDITGLSRSQIAAKQIAHNAISGTDDPDTLKAITRLITEVDDLIESYVDEALMAEPEGDLEAMLVPRVDIDWKIVSLVFLPHQAADLKSLVEAVDAGSELVGLVSTKQYEEFIAAVAKYGRLEGIVNASTTISLLTGLALREIERLLSEADADEKARGPTKV